MISTARLSVEKVGNVTGVRSIAFLGSGRITSDPTCLAQPDGQCGVARVGAGSFHTYSGDLSLVGILPRDVSPTYVEGHNQSGRG